ncbi:MAG TPA: OmpA family protein, partial [Chitinophagales bacterium]|nr:OmpA family protein [Chitinophagales bacterium]
NKNEFSCYHLNAEGNVLFLAIQRGDTYGDMDIYISFLQKNNVWTVPKNLGERINTAATEGSVFIAADNKTLYFASNGRSGFGGFDMYMSKRLDDTWMNWSEPKNLGQQINSKYDDFYYTIPASGDYAYFSSRQNSMGGADLFKIALPKEIQPEPVALITGKIIDKESGKTMEATMEYGGLINIEPIQKFTNADGKYAMIIPGSSYSITIRKEGYFPIFTNPDLENSTMNLDYNATDPVEIIKHTLKQEVNSKLKNYSGDSTEISELIKESYKELENQTTIQDTLLKEITDELTVEYNAQNNFREKNEDIEMIPIREGQVLTLNNVFFDANRSTLKETSKDQLLEIAEFLKLHPNIYVEIGGHTNGLPEDDFCMQLSDTRAKNVAEFIIQQGVESSRVTYKGYGKSFPIADNATLEGRKKNQRVELKIIKIIP